MLKYIKRQVLNEPAMMSPVILAGAEEPHRKFSDVMLHGYDVIRHVAMMTDFTRPPSTSRHVHRRSFVTTSQHETRCEDDRFHTATIYKQTHAQTFICHKHHNMKHVARMTDFTRPPSTSTHVHRRSFVTNITT